MSQPLRSKTPNLEQAERIALTSAWAVGSCWEVTRLTPVAIISPSRTMTAPKGPPPFFTFSIERRIASRIKLFLSCFITLRFLSLIFHFLSHSSQSIVQQGLRKSSIRRGINKVKTNFFFRNKQKKQRKRFFEQKIRIFADTKVIKY